jgi:hypothetical protein
METSYDDLRSTQQYETSYDDMRSTQQYETSYDDMRSTQKVETSYDDMAYAGNSPTSTPKVSIDDKSSKTFKVQLSCGSRHVVVFEASVPVSENRSVNYDSYSVVHLPTDIWSYRNTSARRFSINGNFISRTPDEASENARHVDLIRSWALPDFGGSGATPPILRLTAYGNNNIDDVQVILFSYSVQYPDTVDYIFRGEVPMPVITPISLELVEVYSPKQITDKQWKLNIAKGGFFIYGAGASFGPGMVGSGDSIMNLASSGNFQGIASMNLPSTVTAGNALGDAPMSGTWATSETPNNSDTLNVSESPSISSDVESSLPSSNSERTYVYSNERKPTDYPFDSEEEKKAFEEKKKRRGSSI